ncbi:hypothetical protein TGPRC2_228060 [Toxoplasma gondii TgCatPRC2]|uniref:Uncharacterized protein n=1 Tax=Toxoplasma gondii TgCatPRC2 TaxID=1130821 RepID=A0A151H6T2_TOXGO|nr:hypothetical protein TGPRC2_228060 [Toxoplasma gondii TgCatPRC2]
MKRPALSISAFRESLGVSGGFSCNFVGTIGARSGLFTRHNFDRRSTGLSKDDSLAGALFALKRAQSPRTASSPLQGCLCSSPNSWSLCKFSLAPRPCCCFLVSPPPSASVSLPPAPLCGSSSASSGSSSRPSFPPLSPVLCRRLPPSDADSCLCVSRAKETPGFRPANTDLALRQYLAFPFPHAQCRVVARRVSASELHHLFSPLCRADSSFPASASIPLTHPPSLHGFSSRSLCEKRTFHSFSVCASRSPCSAGAWCSSSVSSRRISASSSPFSSAPLSAVLAASCPAPLGSLASPLHLPLPRSFSSRCCGVSADAETENDPRSSRTSSKASESVTEGQESQERQSPLSSFSLDVTRRVKRLLARLLRWCFGSTLLALPILCLISLEAPLFVVHPEQSLAVRLPVLPPDGGEGEEEELREEGREDTRRGRNRGEDSPRPRGEGKGGESKQGYGGGRVDSEKKETIEGKETSEGQERECGKQGEVLRRVPFSGADTEGDGVGKLEVYGQTEECEERDGGQPSRGEVDSVRPGVRTQAGSEASLRERETREQEKRYRDEATGDGTLVLASPWAVQAFSRGDFVYIRHPMDSQCKLLLRVVAVANDVIRVSAGSLLSIHPTLRKQLLVCGDPRVVTEDGVPFRCDFSYSFLTHLVDLCNEESLAAAFEGRPTWTPFQRMRNVGESVETSDGEVEGVSEIFLELRIPAGSCWLEADSDLSSRGGARCMQVERHGAAKKDNLSAGGGEHLHVTIPTVFQDSYAFGLAPISLIQGIVYAVLPHTHSATEARRLLCQAFLSALAGEARESRLASGLLFLGEKIRRILANVKVHVVSKVTQKRENREGETDGEADEGQRARLERAEIDAGLQWKEADLSPTTRASELQAAGRLRECVSNGAGEKEVRGEGSEKSAGTPGSRSSESRRSTQCQARLREPEAESTHRNSEKNLNEGRRRFQREGSEREGETNVVRTPEETETRVESEVPICLSPEAPSEQREERMSKALPAQLCVLPTATAEVSGEGGQAMRDLERRVEDDRRTREREARRSDASEDNTDEEKEKKGERREQSEAEEDEWGETVLMYRLLKRATQWLVTHADMRGLELPADNCVSSKGTIFVDYAEYQSEGSNARNR